MLYETHDERVGGRGVALDIVDITQKFNVIGQKGKNASSRFFLLLCLSWFGLRGARLDMVVLVG
jgi:hypothetical protein